MFKTALIEDPTGMPWGLIAGLVAFAMLLATGYILVT
jgi:hypothetical protein